LLRTIRTSWAKASGRTVYYGAARYSDVAELICRYLELIDGRAIYVGLAGFAKGDHSLCDLKAAGGGGGGPGES
jgi:hypothetical protein